MNRCGWYGNTEEFTGLDFEYFISNMKDFINDPSEEQINAWVDCFHFLQNVFKQVQSEIDCLNWGLIFEYELPREGGRRPDVLLLIPGRIVVLEFKMKNMSTSSDVEQLTGYLRDLRGYHNTINKFNLQVSGSLVITKAKQQDRIIAMKNKEIYRITDEVNLGKLLMKYDNIEGYQISCEQFLTGKYEPLPTILEAASLIMKNEELPNIRKVNNTNIPLALREIKQVIQIAKETKTHHLVLIAGVPGAGKTLIGLQLAHEEKEAIYLSGNGPLVNVLQDYLNDRTLVQALYNYKREFLSYGNVPPEHIVVFDEAQRAWDSEKMNKPFSEPELIIEMAKKQKEWSVVVALIGQGQEIHTGEESGLKLWNQAIANGSWFVHSDNRLNGYFPNAQEHYSKSFLNLNNTLRNHASIEWHSWVENLFKSNFDSVKPITPRLMSNGINLYVSRNLKAIKNLVSKTYSGTNKQYGYLVSSKGYQKSPLPTVNKKNEYVSYFNHPNSPFYSSRLNYAATEFQTQGLELDLGILCWGYDLQFVNDKWVNSHQDNRLKDPFQIRINSYRVLLTRGRDGTIIYIPDDRKLDSIHNLFLSLGVIELY
ncbi:DNA/RNA helicase domain-containing protein [Virgibacillus litoralis]|uniref:Schlafen group 3-like DNA/RNA helicase domain-containing protein n=1 Tax=Virgibacillus litoralis TaxID=578221 RepID=A0ABS4HGP8_9BACI|nr:DNA/RNA helicase domain-containing protein [Virgibacillus litoralis]MBP1950058.1 hypothetical protein [Virgibacillus litoralis]